MTKKHFIRLADVIRNTPRTSGNQFGAFSQDAIIALADFCQSQNPNFNRDRWLSYIAGECGPSGGKVRRAA